MRGPSARPVFLARAGYRTRRLIDAARLLPILGAILILVPLLWQPAATPEPDTARASVYLFAVWAILIAAAFVLARRLPGPEGPRSQAARPGQDADRPGGGGGG